MAKMLSKERAQNTIRRFDTAIISEQAKTEKYMEERFLKTLQCFEELLSQLPLSITGPLLTKTPKPVKRKGKKIMTIPEDNVPDKCDDSDLDKKAEDICKPKKMSRLSKKTSESIFPVKANEEQKVRRTTRMTSRKATESLLIPKINDSPKLQAKKDRVPKKQLNTSVESMDDDSPKKMNAEKKPQSTARNLTLELEETLNEKPEEVRKTSAIMLTKPIEEQRLTRKRTNQTSVGGEDDKTSAEEPPMKKPNLESEKTARESDDLSLYMDAKNSILSSTMNASALIQKKGMNPMVLLEPIGNATFVVPNKLNNGRTNSIKNSNSLKNGNKKSSIAGPKISKISAIKKQSSLLSDDSLLTEDESDHIQIKKPEIKRILESSDDEVCATPSPPKQTKFQSKAHNDKNVYKNGALFSPYAKESVKKRVEAFEQAASATPQKEPASNMRVTRTKTRALAAASKEPQADRKTEDTDDEDGDSKENMKKMEKHKIISKTVQPKYTTPVSKSRMPLPISSSKLKTPSNTGNYNIYTKPLTATRINNLVTNVESFIPKSSSKKMSSADRSEEKRRQTGDDAKLKKEIQMKALSEAKKQKRELKEQKIREAREAQQKIEQEKRELAEKERAEKAKLALMAKEKAQKEAERKHLQQQQKQQEKERKRREEEYQRQQRQIEQEKRERALEEKKRQEQEHEKKKLAEARAYQLAQTEAMKAKMLAKKQAQTQKPNTYKLESEPEDDSDYESNPKHPIPDWATSTNRKEPLIAQSHVSKHRIMRLFNTRRCTPDLTQLFEGISKQRLKRTSSAIWKSPPRYSLMGD